MAEKEIVEVGTYNIKIKEKGKKEIYNMNGLIACSKEEAINTATHHFKGEVEILNIDLIEIIHRQEIKPMDKLII